MRRGLALILVVGILAVLAVLGSAFAVLSRLERKSSAQRALATRAVLLARSGVEDALARISSGQDPSDWWNRYRGEDWNDDGLVTGLESAAEVFRKGTPNLADCPVRFAMAPSFFKRHGTDLDFNNRKAPDRMRVDGKERGYSGALASGTWALKVEDESGKIHVNGGFLDAGDRDKVNASGGAINGDGIPDHRDPAVRIASRVVGMFSPTRVFKTRGWNDQLVRILNLLGAQGEVGIPNLGTLAVQNRPLGGYASVPDLQRAVGFPDRDLSPWITVDGWSDATVLHPYGDPKEPTLMSLNDVKLGGPSKDRLPCLCEEKGRPPVNLNAASRPVLVALIEGIEGMTWFDYLNDYFANMATFAYDAAQAGAVADRILAQRPFRTWGQFSAFCDSLVPVTVNGFNQGGPPDYPDMRTWWAGGNLCGADLLKANFDPNSMLAKQAPDQLMWRWIDKSDLLVWSTEGCLRPMGRFRISCSALVVDPRGRLLAEASLAGRSEIFFPVRQTTQKDFVGGRSPDASSTSLLSLADLSPVPPTPYQRTTGIGASWNTWGGGRGLGAVTYPCPPTALPAKAADFDGYVGLATVELDPSWLPANAPPSSRLTFLHHFDDAWTADSGTSTALISGPYNSRLQLNVAESVWPAPPVEPNTLAPDGGHMQDQRAPQFAAGANFPADGFGDHGVISYWTKDPIQAPNIAHASCLRPGTQALVIGHRLDYWGIAVECRAVSEDRTWERQDWILYHPPYDAFDDRFLKPGMRWHLVTGSWDTDQLAPGDDVRCRVTEVRGSGTRDARSGYPSYNTGTLERLVPTSNFILGANAFDLGEYFDANHILDELAVYDFGDTASDMLQAADVLHAERWKEGRYYKGGDARFLSTVLRPAGTEGVQVLGADWTAYLPTENRQELLTPYVGGWFSIPDEGQPRMIDPVLSGGAGGSRIRVEVDLVEVDAAGTPTGKVRLLERGGRIAAPFPAFRYRVRFPTELADPQNDPVNETPFLDDITFFCQRRSGPRFLSAERP